MHGTTTRAHKMRRERGTTMGVDCRSCPSRELRIESVSEFIQILTASRDIIRRWLRYERTGVMQGDPQQQAEQAEFVISTIRYAVRLWIAEGAWPVYYRVRGGQIHDCMGCRAIHPLHTIIEPVLDLTDVPLDEVIARGYRVCGHCRRRTHAQAVARIERMAAVMCQTLAEIAAALHQEAAK